MGDLNDFEAVVGRPLPSDPEFERQQGAEGKAAAIPNWAMWTEEEALNWHDTNIQAPLGTVPDIDTLTPAQFNNNAQAIMALYQDVLAKIEDENRAIVRMVVALRNKAWPGLEGS